MQALDAQLFALLTAGPGAPGWAVALASFLATWVVPLVALALVVAWLRSRDRALLDAVASGLIGLEAVQVMGWALYRPRPFELGQGLNLMHHLPENSFPSDHATLMLALAFSLLLARRPWAWGLLTLALAVGGARVYLGAHWPGDILGGAVLGLASALVLRRIALRQRAWATIEAVCTHLTGR